MTGAWVYDSYAVAIPDEWIDYNGHLTDSAYGIVVSAANEAMLASVDLSSDYLARTGRSLYTVESHIWYRSEVKQGRLRATSHLMEVRPKSLRVRTTVLREDDVDAAHSELVYLHVEHGTGRVVPFDDDLFAALTSLLGTSG